MVTRFPLPVAALRFDAERAARWLTVVLVIALGSSLAQLTWQLLPRPALPSPPQAVPTKATAVSANTPRLEAVVALHLFGTAEATATPGGSKINAPETSLNLTLRGLFAVARKQASFAIIAEGGNNERYFRIGDKISGGAKVHDILADRVVLERNGSLEILRLPKERLEFAVPPTPTAAQTKALEGRREQLRELRDSIKDSPQEVMNMAELQPAMVEGQLRGYRIRPRRHLELFQASGLTANDIVTAVNGIPVTDPAQFSTLTSQLSNAPSLRLSIERPNGTTDEIVIDLN